MMTQQVNLFQPIFRKEKKLLSFNALLVACALVIVVLLTIFGWGWRQTQQIQADLLQLENRLAVRSAELTELTTKLASANSDTRMYQQMTSLEQELAARKKGVEVLLHVREAYTKGVSTYLESFSRQAPKGVWLTGFMVQAGGEGLVIRGNSLKPAMVPVFLEQLSSEPSLKGTRFRLLQINREDTDSSYVGFTVFTGTEVPEFSTVETGR